MSDLPSAADRFGPYDERNMIRYTIFRYQPSLMTEIECKAQLLFHLRAKVSNPVSLEFREQQMRARWSAADDAMINEALALGWRDFQFQVTDRILAVCPEKLVLNRCPVCQKIVLTPEARWCMWCHHDWH